MRSFASRSWTRARQSVLAEPALVLLAMIVVPPLAWAAGYAVVYSLGGAGALRSGWTLAHWRSALTTGGLVPSVLLSLMIAAGSTLLAASAALGFVFCFPPTRGQMARRSLLLLPLATPVAVTAWLVQQLLSGGGFCARLLFHLGAIESPADFPELVNDRWAIGMLLAQSYWAFPLLALYFTQLWRSARLDALCRLAESLGATKWQTRWRVALPVLVRRGRSLMLLVFLLSLGSYEIPLVLGRQSPQMFSVLTQRRSGLFDLTKRPEAFALATVYLVLAVTLLWVYMTWRRRRDE